MRGADGRTVPYMSGNLYGMSIGLAAHIVHDDWPRSVLYLAYGSSSEDVDVGRWVDFVKEEHGIAVDFVGDASLLRDLEKVEAETRAETNPGSEASTSPRSPSSLRLTAWAARRTWSRVT